MWPGPTVRVPRARLIASALRVAGFRTGLYTSPHLVNPRERIEIDGEWIGEGAWVAAFEEPTHAAERLLAREGIGRSSQLLRNGDVRWLSSPSPAPVLKSWCLRPDSADGWMPPTSSFPEVAVITSIDFDHEAFLGSSIESIAAEKAGILKAGRPEVFAAQRPDALSVLEQRALDLDIPVLHSSAWRVEGLELRSLWGAGSTLVSDEEIPARHARWPGCIRWRIRERL